MSRKSKFCDKCGSEISVDSRFCPVCGARQTIFASDLPRERDGRPVSIGIAAVLSGLFGILEFFFGITLLFLGSVALGIPVPLLNFLAGAFYYIVAFPFVLLGVLDMIGSAFLWDCKKSGGVIVIISSIVGCLLSIPFYPLSVIDIFINIVMILLVSAGWSKLK